MRRIDSQRRAAFSLLEMVLALAIAMLVLLALYLTLSTQLTSSQIGRETLAEGEVARSILARITNDIVNQMGPVDPRGFPVYDTEMTDPAAAADPAAPAPMTTTDTGTAINFNFGIRGDESSVIISSYRVQRPPPMAAGSTDASGELTSDLRQVAIWLATNGSDPLGLARHEIKQATSVDLDTEPMNLPDQDKLVFAKEVRSIAFEYFDGVSWLTEWDGSAAAGEDGTARVGPPSAIKVTITLRKHNNPNVAAAALDNDQGPSYQRIIALPAGNNFPQPTTTP